MYMYSMYIHWSNGEGEGKQKIIIFEICFCCAEYKSMVVKKTRSWYLELGKSCINKEGCY